MITLGIILALVGYSIYKGWLKWSNEVEEISTPAKTYKRDRKGRFSQKDEPKAQPRKVPVRNLDGSITYINL